MNNNPLLEPWENLTDDELALAQNDWFKRNENSIKNDRQFWNRTNLSKAIKNNLNRLNPTRWKDAPRGNPHKGKRKMDEVINKKNKDINNEIN